MVYYTRDKKDFAYTSNEILQELFVRKRILKLEITMDT